MTFYEESSQVAICLECFLQTNFLQSLHLIVVRLHFFSPQIWHGPVVFSVSGAAKGWGWIRYFSRNSRMSFGRVLISALIFKWTSTSSKAKSQRNSRRRLVVSWLLWENTTWELMPAKSKKLKKSSVAISLFALHLSTKRTFYRPCRHLPGWNYNRCLSVVYPSFHQYLRSHA